MTLTWLDYAAVFLATAIGQTFGTLFGGGSLFIQPVLLLVGIPPHVAIAHDVAAESASCLFFVFLMHRQGYVQWRATRWMAGPVIVGAVAGAAFLAHIPAHALIWMVIIICLLGLGYTLACLIKKTDLLPGHNKLDGTILHAQKKDFVYWPGWQWAAVPAALLMGVYNGISGIGAGMLALALFTLVFRASPKTMIATANAVSGLGFLAAGIAFIGQGLLQPWLLGLMVAGNLLAAWLASRVIKIVSDKHLRLVFAVVVALILGKLVYSQLSLAQF